MANEKNTVVVYLRVLRAVNKELDRRAKKRGVTKQQVLRELIERALGMECAA